ncbi:MAG: hypothetical protein FD187_1386 [bacterium]|nr:MAG: hypothetical protein FD142_2335 [bacterium]KAF0149027.1 MAG: hypothetical protein FD187_1386 [bacterium]KAF0168481.1 MAG: hypothetical protein FD158_1392 [bacterium]TXT20769.1 MAG: hypothetical protein FD132_1001 [bacterium]
MLENTYGIAKRFGFVAGVIDRLQPDRVLDIGCGTGTNLTKPLAERFPCTTFVGMDSDPASVDFANREDCPANARFHLDGELSDPGYFDLVIASEVIEHVEDPDAFLAFLRERLTPGGMLLLTLPNGLGPFELASLAETLMHLTGIYAVLRWIKRRLRGQAIATTAADTLAISPHINFFSLRSIRSAIAFAGFEIVESRPRTLLCGFGFDQLLTSSRMIKWNTEVADRVPMSFASAWMFLLKPAAPASAEAYHRGAYAQLRRFLNEKRWHLR